MSIDDFTFLRAIPLFFSKIERLEQIVSSGGKALLVLEAAHLSTYSISFRCVVSRGINHKLLDIFVFV